MPPLGVSGRHECPSERPVGDGDKLVAAYIDEELIGALQQHGVNASKVIKEGKAVVQRLGSLCDETAAGDLPKQVSKQLMSAMAPLKDELEKLEHLEAFKQTLEGGAQPSKLEICVF